MMNKLIKIWIGLIILSGVLIFIHSQELRNENQEVFFNQSQMRVIEILNSSNEKEVFNKNRNQFLHCNSFNAATKKYGHYDCEAIRKIQENKELNVRP
ncbi:MAG: hypothetical protein AB8H03_04130 [Saprospiraceae bacterium]